MSFQRTRIKTIVLSRRVPIGAQNRCSKDNPCFQARVNEAKNEIRTLVAGRREPDRQLVFLHGYMEGTEAREGNGQRGCGTPGPSR